MHAVRSLILFVVLGCTNLASAQTPRPPNVVLIVADDLGWADLGCYGNQFNETPHLDKFAGQGLKFTQFYAAGAVCSPTRASIQTGQYQARCGLTAHIPGHWRPFEKLAEPPCALNLPLELDTIAKQFKRAEYATGYFGKWHLGDNSHKPGHFGYDEVVELGGHDTPGKRVVPPQDKPKRTAEVLGDLTIKFLEDHQQQPFFVHVNHIAVHIPLTTTPGLQQKYEQKSKDGGYSCHPTYAGLLEEMDTSVGRVLATLDRLNLTENTLVIFTSDNGGLEREAGGWPGTLNRPLRNEKGSLYEGGIRVPCLVRWPQQISAPAVVETPACSVDFYPTFGEMLNAKPRNEPVDGVSFAPLFRNPRAALDRTALYWHYPHYHHSRPASAIRSGDFKLLEFFDTGELELYDLRADLSEAKNLAEQQPAVVRKLHAQLQQWRLAVNAQLPQPNPGYDPARAGEWWSRAKVAPTEAPGFFKE